MYSVLSLLVTCTILVLSIVNYNGCSFQVVAMLQNIFEPAKLHDCVAWWKINHIAQNVC